MIWAIVALILVGLALLLLEIITPSFGVLFGLGAAAFAVAIWLTFRLSRTAGIVMAAVLVPAIPAYLWFSVHVLRETAAGRRLFLGKARPGAAEGVPEAAEEDAMVGRTGTTETVLRPTGAVRVNGKRVIALAEGQMIEKGVTVRVVRRAGMNVVVRPVEQAP